MRRSTTSFRRRAGGFTLVELLVTLLALTVVIIAALNLFDAMNRLTRVQVQVSDLQQELRVGQREMVSMVRAAGRGGLVHAFGAGPVNVGRALAVRNNVGFGGVSEELAIGYADTPMVLKGSDVLTIRGVLTTPLYQLDYTATSFAFDDASGTGTLVIPRLTPTGVPQDLSPIAAVTGDDFVPEALVLVSALNDMVYGVAEMTAGSTVTSDAANLAFRIGDSANAIAYAGLSQTAGGGLGFPSGRLRSDGVAYVGILEEHRFYLQVDPDDPELTPRLSRARMFPNTEAPYSGDDANLSLEIARDIYDLQVALGFDSHLGGGFFASDTDNEDDDDLIVDAGNAQDDWLFNSTADDVTQSPWTGPWNNAAEPQPELYYVRLSTLAATHRTDPGYRVGDDALDQLEDHSYSDDTDHPLNTDYAQRLRRQLLQTVIDLRNL